jgi:2-methylcitrate dehydratase PrpD
MGMEMSNEEMSTNVVTTELNSVTFSICHYLVNAQFSSIPEQVREIVKIHILDSIACMVGGSTLIPSQIAFNLIQSMGGKAEATVLGTNRKLPLLLSCYLNSFFANALDFDDTEFGHPGATIIPPALSIGEKMHVDGRKLILAILLGYEISLRIVSAIKPSQERWRKVAASSTPQIFGSVTVASKLLDLDVDKTRVAFGLAGSNAPVPAIRKFGTRDGGSISWLKNNYGFSSFGGVLAAQLASEGFIGPQTILDGERGFWIMAGSDQCNFNEMINDLGIDYRIKRVSFKPYTCCRFFHAAIDGVCQIISEFRLDINQINKIQITSVSQLLTFMNYKPTDPIDIQFSLPFSIALSALNIAPGYSWFRPENLADSRIINLAQRVSLAIDEMAESLAMQGKPYETIVTIVSDSKTYQKRIGPPLGHPTNPLNIDSLLTKFHSLVDPILGEVKATNIYYKISKLETCHDISNLFSDT